MADRLANQPGCDKCGCGPCDEVESCFRLMVCGSFEPDLAMTIAGAALDRTPTGESESGSTGAAGEAFCHTWASVPAWARVDFAWKDCNLAAYLPTALCSYSFDFDVCIARDVLVEAYDILDDSTVADVQVCVQGRVVANIPWDDGRGLCVPSPTTRNVYWWNIPPSYAASGLDCDMEYTGTPPSTALANDVAISTTGLLVGSSPDEYAPYVWECNRTDPWCCEDAAELSMGGLPIDDPDGLWSFLPCWNGTDPFLSVPPGGFTGFGGWGCPTCRAADDMAYSNLNAWALNVQYDINATYYYPSGVYGLSPLSHDVVLSGTMPYACTPLDMPNGLLRLYDSGPITVSWPAGIYYFPGDDPADWKPYNVTSIRIVFGAYTDPLAWFGRGWLIILALANDIPPGGVSFDGCDRGGRNPQGWTIDPDTPDDIFVQMTEGGPPYGGPCDHHIDWLATATLPYTPETCKLYGTVSVTGPV